jgi:ribose transport system substrate-binding protein
MFLAREDTMSQSKRLLTFISLIALVLPLVNCGGSPHAATEIYFLVAINIDIPYFQSAAAGLNRAGAQLGVKVDFVGPDTYDPEAQVKEFRKVLEQNPAGIMVSPADPTLMKPEIDRAVAQGVPVITIDSDSPESKRLLYIGTDNYQAGTIGARVAVKELEGKGNVVVFSMPGQANLNDRLRGYRDVFAEQPQVKITEVVDIKGDPAIAFDKTTEIVEKGIANVDAFACLVSIACKEVAEVLDRRRVTGKVIVAMDTEELTLEWIQKGAIAATVAQKPFTMAFTALKMLDDLHHHAPASLEAAWAQDPFSPIPTFVDTGATLIDKSNVESFLQAQESATSPGGQ